MPQQGRGTGKRKGRENGERAAQKAGIVGLR